MRLHAQQAAQTQDTAHARLPSPASRLKTDPSYEIPHLESMVEQALDNLQMACTALQTREKELQGFLSDYHAQVGAFTDELERLQRDIADYDRKINVALRKKRGKRSASGGREEALLQLLMDDLPQLPKTLHAYEWQEEMENIYAQLVQLYRNDAESPSKGRYAAQVKQMIDAVYKRHNLWAMRAIEHRLVEHAVARYDTPQSKVARLRERFDAITASVAQATYRKTWLENSHAWRMKERMEHDRYLLEIVIHRAKQHITEAKRILTRKKIEWQALADK